MLDKGITIVQALFLCVFRKLKVCLKKLKPKFGQETQGIGVNLIFIQKNSREFNFQGLIFTGLKDILTFLNQIFNFFSKHCLANF